LIKRSLTLAETIARSDDSMAAAHSLYDSLSSPLCVWNGEAERELRLLSIGMYLDGKNLGQYTARVLETYEPNVIWERRFLEVRKACYAAIRSPRAEQAARDLDQFVNNEALTTDVPALTREIEIGAREKAPEANSNQKASKQPSPQADLQSEH